MGARFAIAAVLSISPADLTRSVAGTAAIAVPVASLSAPKQAVSHKAVYQHGLAPVVVGLLPNGSAIGYRLVLLAVIPGNVSESDEVRIRRSIASIVAPVTDELWKTIDYQPALERGKFVWRRRRRAL